MMDPFAKLEEELSGEAAENKAKEMNERKEMQKNFREVFGTYNGKKVLNVLLNDLMLFQPTHTEAETALRNYATFLLNERMGYKDTVSLTEQIVLSKTEE